MNYCARAMNSNGIQNDAIKSWHKPWWTEQDEMMATEQVFVQDDWTRSPFASPDESRQHQITEVVGQGNDEKPNEALHELSVNTSDLKHTSLQD